jgi:hypothetical protein
LPYVYFVKIGVQCPSRRFKMKIHADKIVNSEW